MALHEVYSWDWNRLPRKRTQFLLQIKQFRFWMICTDLAQHQPLIGQGISGKPIDASSELYPVAGEFITAQDNLLVKQIWNLILWWKSTSLPPLRAGGLVKILQIAEEQRRIIIKILRLSMMISTGKNIPFSQCSRGLVLPNLQPISCWNDFKHLRETGVKIMKIWIYTKKCGASCHL